MNYYNQTSYISNSNLTELKKLLFSIPDAPPMAYSFGSLVDAMLTEPNLVDEYEMILYDHNGNEERFHELDFKRAKDMVKNLKAYPMVQLFLNAGEKQFEFYNDDFKVSEFTIKARCKLDFYAPRLRIGGDLKTTACKSQSQFIQSLNQFDYDRQCAWYMDLLGLDKFVFIGASKQKPYSIFAFTVNRGDEFYSQGKAKYEWLVERYCTLILPLIQQ